MRVAQQTFRVNGKVGYNGISYNSREGDGKTPAGVYSFGIGFGIAGNPGSNIGYRQVTANDYWVDDVNSPYYNKWVSTAEVVIFITTKKEDAVLNDILFNFILQGMQLLPYHHVKVHQQYLVVLYVLFQVHMLYQQ